MKSGDYSAQHHEYIASPEKEMISIPMLAQRSKMMRAVRSFFQEQGFWEVETPLLLPTLAPEAHIEPMRSGSWFLQTSPELCMKRLLAAGAAKIFQICKCFRGQERGDRHLPEFTMLEWYRANADYQELMADCEELLRFLALRLEMTAGIRTASGIVSLAPPWERLSVAAAFQRYSPVTLNEAMAAGDFDELLVRYVEPRLGLNTPTFLYDYPASLGSLARLKAGDPTVAERFELYVNGLELANGFSELSDVAEQRARFVQERARIKEFGRDAGPMPQRFLEALAEMGPAAGIALGVDRLVLLFAGAERIDQVVAFIPEEL